jgi:hypothetical protein
MSRYFFFVRTGQEENYLSNNKTKGKPFIKKFNIPNTCQTMGKIRTL